MYGGPSQLDLFDYKPELQLRDGQSIDNEFRRSTHTKAVLQASRRSFRQHGQSGVVVLRRAPHLSRHMDKMAMIHSLTSDSFAHGSALLNMNTGRAIQGHPSLGAWISYGLGELNENLPAYVVMLWTPQGGPPPDLPIGHMDTCQPLCKERYCALKDLPIMNLTPARGTAQSTQRHQIELTQHFNRFHLENRDHASWLEARIRSYELAFRLQMTAPEALDIESESQPYENNMVLGRTKDPIGFASVPTRLDANALSPEGWSSEG